LPYRSRGIPQAHAPARSTQVKARPVAPLLGAGLFLSAPAAPVECWRRPPEEETAVDIDVATPAKATAADAPSNL